MGIQKDCDKLPQISKKYQYKLIIKHCCIEINNDLKNLIIGLKEEYRLKIRPKGIYCLEIGEWYGSLKKKTSVESVLQLLHDSPLEVPYIHRDIATKEELSYYIKKWTQARHDRYPILYLAFHGSPCCIHLYKANGHDTTITIDALFELLKDKCHRRVIHFGSCESLDINGNTINKYLRDSGAVCISGYSESVDWVFSTVFEMWYLAELQLNEFTKSGMEAVKKRLHKQAAYLTKEFKFKMRIKK